jgi:hypothetical protein
MASDDFLDFEARSPRHETTGTARLAVEVKCRSASPAEPREAQLIDLSRGGFQLLVPIQLVQHETISARIRDEKSGLQFDLSGHVRWQRQTTDGKWLVGCQADQELDWETMGELFLNEILVLD